MSSEPKPKNISKVVQRYIERYQSETAQKKEYIYQLSPSEIGELADFLRNDSGRAYICFYPLSEEEYDKNFQHFATAQFIQPKYMALKDNKLKLGLNIVIPTRNGHVDRSLIVELIAHELNHAYTTWHEIKQKHISHPVGIIASIKDALKSQKHKYTYTKRIQRYSDILPTNDNTMHDEFRWVGYFGVQTEQNANLAGIDAFLTEHNNDASKLKNSRGYQLFNIIYNRLKNIKENATEEDWKWAQKNATYINNRANETLSQFKKRYIKYYENLFSEFQIKVNKILDKHKMKSAKFKSAQNKLNQKQNTPKFLAQNRQND